MDRKQVMKMFNKETRIGVLATSNKNGDVNTAVFGSPRMIDEDTVIMAIGDNRSLQYLQENPKASFIVVEPGEAPTDWKGARLYLEMDPLSATANCWTPFGRRSAKWPVTNLPMRSWRLSASTSPMPAR